MNYINICTFTTFYFGLVKTENFLIPHSIKIVKNVQLYISLYFIIFMNIKTAFKINYSKGLLIYIWLS